MFERFTAEARRAVRQAVEEAGTAGHEAVLADDLLLAVLRLEEGDSRAPALAELTYESAREARESLDREALASIGISLDRIRGAATATAAPPPRRLPFAGEAKHALEQTLREALALGHRSLGTGHILLALLRQDGGRVAELLDEMRVDRAALATALARALARPGGDARRG